MRLVDRKQRDLGAFEKIQGFGFHQSFRRDVKEPQFAARDLIADRPIVVGIVGGIERGGRYAIATKPRHLIAHQRDQRRHHDGQAIAQQRRQLVAQRFAAAGRHHRQHIAAVEDRGDDLVLPRPEGFEAEGGAKDSLCRGEVRHSVTVQRDCSIFVLRGRQGEWQACHAKKAPDVPPFLQHGADFEKLPSRTSRHAMLQAVNHAVGPPVGRLVRLLGLMWLAGVAMRMTLLVVPPVISLVHEQLHMSETQIGLLIGLPLAMFAIAAVPGSLLIARIGAKPALILGMFIAAFAGGARGAAIDVWTLYAASIVTGFGIAIMQPACRRWCATGCRAALASAPSPTPMVWWSAQRCRPS